MYNIQPITNQNMLRIEEWLPCPCNSFSLCLFEHHLFVDDVGKMLFLMTLNRLGDGTLIGRDGLFIVVVDIILPSGETPKKRGRGENSTPPPPEPLPAVAGIVNTGDVQSSPKCVGPACGFTIKTIDR